MNDSRDVINLKTSNQTTKQEIELVWYFCHALVNALN